MTVMQNQQQNTYKSEATTYPQMLQIPKSNFEIPFVLWGSKPIKNKICQISSLPDSRTILSGSVDGQIVVWRTDPNNSSILQARMMLFGHNTEITTLSPASLNKDCKRFVSTSVSGEMCLWDSEEGRCIDNIHNSVYIHRKIIPHDMQHQKSTRLFCCGDYPEIIVMDPNDLAILFTLTSRVEPDWISALSVVRPFEKHDVVIGLSMSGMVKLWSLVDVEKRQATNNLNEDESQVLSLRSIHSISCSELNKRIMLIISSNCWQIVDLTDLKPLTVSECKVDAVNGTIIDTDKVAIGFADSNVVLFQLPRSRLTGRQSREKFGDKPKDIGGFDHPWVFAVLKGCQVSPLSPLQNVCFYFENERNTVYRGDQSGNLSIWHLPKQFDPLIEEYLRTKRPVLYEANASQSMQSLWNLMSNNVPPSISEIEEGKQITSSLYIHHQGNLVLGREDGSIVLRYSIHALMRQLLDFNTPESRKTRVLHGHYTAVTALLYPHDECARYDASILVSGGNDFSVIVWNIYTGCKVHRFNVQGGPIVRLMVTPNNATKKVQCCICSIAKDNSVALLSLKDNSCLVLASRQLTPVIDVKFRPLDDFMLVKCEDTSIFVWQMETGNLERIVTGLYVDEIMDACDEQIGLYDVNDNAGAAQAVQFLRAIKNKNLNAVKKFVTQNERESDEHDGEEINIPPPIKIEQLKKISNEAYLVTIDLQSLIMGLLAMNKEFNKTKKAENVNETSEMPPLQKRINLGNKNIGSNKKYDTSLENFNVYIDTAKFIISLLHAWNVDLDLDGKLISCLNLYKPKYPINYGIISRHHSFVSLYLPMAGPKVLKSQLIPAELMSFTSFSKQVHWHLSSSITTLHLLSIIAISNTIMSMKDTTLKHTSAPISTRRRGSLLNHQVSTNSQNSELENDTEIRNKKQVWSLILSLHCVSLFDMIEYKKDFCYPRIELLARKWQDSCIEIREAAQTLLIKELKQLKSRGREELINAWSAFLPSNLDKKNSIFSLSRNCTNSVSGSAGTFVSNKPLATEMIVPPTSRLPPVRPPPPIPPRPNISQKNSVVDTDSVLKERSITLPSIKTCEGLQQLYKNQASAIVILGVIGAHFSSDLSLHPDLARATSHSLLELLIASPSQLLPIETPLRRAAIDLLGKGFTVWQPHLDISKVLLGLLELASSGDNTEDTTPGASTFPLTPAADACRTAKYALSLIASVRPQALILALSTEVARFNSATQHQTIQQSFVSPLVKANVEILRIIEQLTEKQYNDIIDLIIPVGDILVHCLEPPILKTTPLVKLFPPIAKFHMVAYCAQSRRIGFGGKNGKIVIHDLKTSKTQSIQAHSQPITAIDFSPDGKILAVYCATEAKISLWQSQQSFLGMGPGQVKCIKSLNAPAEFPIETTGGTPQIFKAKLVFNGSKALTLVLPNGKESRFTLN